MSYEGGASLLKKLLGNFSEEKKNEIGLEITLFSIIYFIFIYPSGGFKLNFYLLITIILYIALAVSIIISNSHPKKIRYIRIMDKKVTTADISGIITADVVYLISIFVKNGFKFGSLTFYDISFLIVLDIILLVISIIKELGN